MYDVVVIGSGAAGALSAYPLVLAGLRVLMIDGGLDQSAILDNWPATTFEETRKNDSFQRRLFLGEKLDTLLHLKENHSVQMTTGFRSYVTQLEKSQEPLKIQNSSFSLLQSFALGGLSEAWGGVCDFLDSNELTEVGLPPVEMQKCYQQVCDIIGVSGKHDQYSLQPPAYLDDNGRQLQKTAQLRKKKLDQRGIKVYQPPLAVLTRRLKNRLATNYSDMDFWINTGKSLFRPHFLIQELQTYPNFFYQKGWIVDELQEHASCTRISAHQLDQIDQKKQFRARRTILAAGSINSTRIMLKSLNLFNYSTAIIIKPHVIVPSLQWRKLGQAGDQKRLSLCQLAISYKPQPDSSAKSYAQVYSYKSLLLYKLLPYIPLPTPIALRLLSLIAPALVLVDIRFSETRETIGSLSLLRTRYSTREKLHITYPPIDVIKKQCRSTLKEMSSVLKELGLLTLTTNWMPTGSTAHYAGGIPFQSASDPSTMLSTLSNGQVAQMKHVYVADASCWRTLSAKPPTLTIMANAYRVGLEVQRSLLHSGKKMSDDQRHNKSH